MPAGRSWRDVFDDRAPLLYQLSMRKYRMPKLFAVIPAAGHSRRMGRPKLLLPLGGKTVLARTLEALAIPEVAARIVVVRPDDDELADAATASAALVVRPPLPPPEMRASVEHALREIEARFTPDPSDGWMLAPADHPVLDQAVVERLWQEWRDRRPPILVPTCAGRRGHPTLFRWDLTPAIFALPPDRGLNQLLRDHQADVRELAVDAPSILVDLDTPEDYAALCRLHGDGLTARPD